MAENETLEKPLTTKVNFATPVEKKEQGKETPKPDGDEFVVDFSLDGSDKAQPKELKVNDKGTVEAVDKKPNYSRFKDFVGKEEISEDDIETTWKKDREELNSYKEKAGKLEIVAQGSNKLKDDKEYQSWKSWVGAKPEDLVVTSIAYDYMEDGMDEKAATAKAQERLKREVEKNPEWVEDTARGIRKNLKNYIAQREQAVQTEIENASKDISFVNPTSDFEGKVKETWSKTEDFLGMKLPKDEKERTKLVSEAYIPPSKLNEQLKDPSTYQEVCLYLKYKKQWKANIESRTNGKSKVLDRLPKTPSIGSGLTVRGNTPAQGAKGFSGEGFLGRKAS